MIIFAYFRCYSTHLSSLTIYFKSDDFLTSVRNELYGPMDFLAKFWRTPRSVYWIFRFIDDGNRLLCDG
jgi:hypothetical protein